MTLAPRKIASGIPGFDSLSHGGLPAARVTVLRGEPGAGKTVFALQHLCSGTRAGDSGLFVSFEERPSNLEQLATSFGWGATLERDAPAGVRVIDARPQAHAEISGDFDLSGLLAIVDQHIRDGVRRVVFDGLDGLLQLLGAPTSERREFTRLYQWAEAQEVSCLITTRRVGAHASEASADRAEMLEFLSDCVIDLHHRSKGASAIRELRISKYRGSAHASEHHPVLIGDDGMLVGRILDQPFDHPVSTERISTGIPRLDTMLGDGVYRGTCVLLSGAPGTAKTTISGAFAAAACARGERVLLVSFDEAPAQIQRNLKGVGLDLTAPEEAGLLKLASHRAISASAEARYDGMRQLIEAHDPALVIIDPLNALLDQPDYDVDVGRRLIDFVKERGATLVATALIGSDKVEGTPVHVSTIADTWIHLSFNILGGERNRALTVIKSRGSSHSNQVRELILSAAGITLADVYTAGGEVLMGTARMERERELERVAAERRIAFDARMYELELAQGAAASERDSLELRIAQLQREQARLETEEADRTKDSRDDRASIATTRFADGGTAT
ncbi:MAG TPA: circadian clock protein KaiC [Pseudomonadales bacterium]|nr:circadian clock protein KaiC [Pseudomonadales bacterium]